MKKHLPFIIVLLIFSFIVHWQWFFTLGALSHGDFQLDYLNRSREFFALPTAWESVRLFGFPNLGLTFWNLLFFVGTFAQFGFSPELIERLVTLWPIGILSSVSMYILAYYVLRSRVAAFFASLIYAYTPFFLIAQTGNITASAAQSIGPLLFTFLLLMVEKKKFLYMILAVITAYVMGLYEFRYLYMELWIFLIYLVYYVGITVQPKNRVESLKHIGIVVFFWGVAFVFINAYWLFGLLNSGAIISNEVFSRGLTGFQFVDIAKTLAFFPYLWTGGDFRAFVVQPIPYYFWIYPILAFLGLLYSPKNKKIIFFAVIGLIGVFLAKHINPPLPTVYLWLFDHLPGFNAFRESTKFYFVIQIAYSILIGAFITYLLTFSKNKIVKLFTYVLLGILVVLTFIYTKPFITGEIKTLFAPKIIPSEYKELTKFIMNDKYFYRTVVVPVAQRFFGYNAVHPTMGFVDMDDKLQSLNPKLLTLENIKYVILPYDSENDIYHDWGPREAFERFINKSVTDRNNEYSLSFFKDFGNIKVYENTSKLLPRIVPVEQPIHINGTDNINDVINIPTSENVAYIFDEQIPPKLKEEQVKLINERNDNKLPIASKLYSVANCIRCDLSKQYYDYVQFPFARYLPDSPLYPIIQFKDGKQLSAINDPTSLNKAVFLSTKRIIEVQSMIKKNSHPRYIVNTLNNNNELLNRISEDYNKLAINDDNNDIFLSVYDYLALERKILYDIAAKTEELHPDIQVDSEVSKVMRAHVYKLSKMIDEVARKTWYTTDNKNKKFTVSVPENGKYTLLVKNEEDINEKYKPIIFEDKIVNPVSKDNNFINYGEIDVTKGKHRIAYQVDPINLLELGASSSGFTITSDNSTTDKQIKITNLDNRKSQYKLSIEYQIVNGDPPRIYISDDASIIDAYTNTGMLNYSLDYTLTGDGHTFETYFSPHFGVKDAYLHIIIPKPEYAKSVTEIKKITLERVIVPDIILVKDKQKELKMPQIDYTEVNPTLFRVRVHNAQDKFFLSFSERFDNNWHAYISDDKDFVSNRPIVQSYLGGNVNELAYIYSPSLSYFLQLLNKKHEPDSLHWKVNEFANGYLINKKGDFTIDFVYDTQSYVLIGFLISLAAFVVIIGALIYLIYKNK